MINIFYLQIFEGNQNVTHVVLCGDHLFQPNFNQGETISNVMYVQFYSDFELSAAGFELTFEHSAGSVKLYLVVI